MSENSNYAVKSYENWKLKNENSRFEDLKSYAKNRTESVVLRMERTCDEEENEDGEERVSKRKIKRT